ncbi:hypothetical protein PENTCL1PPCAC_22677 [Pristionchus entomophagus]|uniref:Uncharacterized protein n=1 Tax=Pristionchus entomophagus TaxID=358040 RepID=A0AAV5U2B3_9BILA|nr:hypothetical protein PENTCL1PPCAC_22677 [Pristionchus entomophagus]
MPSKYKVLTEFCKEAMQATADACKDGKLYDDEANSLSATLKVEPNRLKKFVTNKHYYNRNKKIKALLVSAGAFNEESTITPQQISKIAADTEARVSRVENVLKREMKRKTSSTH